MSIYAMQRYVLQLAAKNAEAATLVVKQELLRAHEDGATMREMADAIGVGTATVHRWVQQAREMPRPYTDQR